MSSERDIERILDAWLAPGPAEMPDRLYHEVLHRVGHVPQRRSARAMRFTTMFSSSKLPLAAALAALAIGLASATLWLGPPDADPAPGALAPTSPAAVSSATPQHSPTPSPSSAGALPDQLRGSWAAAPRVVPGLSLSESIAQWTIDTTFHADYQGVSLGSAVSVAGPGQIRLENIFGGQGCPAGAVGTYAWTLSEQDTRITLEALGDDCAARASYLTGTWTWVACEIGWTCVGRLQPGRYGSAVFDPRAAAEPRAARPGAVSYEVPEGWANADDWLARLMLVPESGFQRLLDDPNVWPDQVAIWSAAPVGLVLEGPDCEWREDPASGETAESLAAWLTSHPDLAVTGSEPITIDGHEGFVVDIDMALDEETACPTPFESSPGVKLPGVPLFADRAGITPDGRHVAHWDQGGWDFGSGGVCADCLSDPQRIILLDLDGLPLVILVDSEKPEDQAALVEQAMPIVESFRFPE